MLSLPPITLRLRGWKLIDRVAIAFLLLCSIALGAGCGLLFVYASDLPEIRALETYRPNVVTEIYADDGQMVGSFALRRRILQFDQGPQSRRRQHHHHAACWQPFPGQKRPQLSTQNAGDAAIAADRAALHKAANFYDVHQPGLSGAWELRICRRVAILFRQAGYRPEAAGSCTACGNGAGSDLFAAERSAARAGTPESGPAQNAGRRKNYAERRSSSQENSAWAAYPISSQ